MGGTFLGLLWPVVEARPGPELSVLGSLLCGIERGVAHTLRSSGGSG